MDSFGPYDSSYYTFEDLQMLEWEANWGWLWEEPMFGYFPPELSDDEKPFFTDDEIDYYLDEE